MVSVPPPAAKGEALARAGGGTRNAQTPGGRRLVKRGIPGVAPWALLVNVVPSGNIT